MNVEKLRKLKAYILEEPRRYRQEKWFFSKDDREFLEQNPACGTMGCLAGNACLMEGYKPILENYLLWKVQDCEGVLTDPDDTAAKILGLTKFESVDLFNSFGWGSEARNAYWSAESPEARAKAAAMELDRLIELAERESR